MNLLIPLAISVSLAGTAPPPDVVKMDMRIDSPDRDVGKTMRLFVSVDLKDGWTGNAGKAPNFILQVDAPECVEMQGPRLEGIRNLSRNGFLRPPEEKMMEGRETSFEFKIMKAPSKDDHFAVNLIGYVTDADNTDVWYTRRRMAISLTKDAKPIRIDESPSNWGIGNELELGDKAVPFKLPQADGTEVDLSQYLGKKNIIVSTYRAFWWPYCATQLVQLQNMYDEFDARDTVAIAIAQEDKDLETHAKFLTKFDGKPPFFIVADIGREQTQRYDRTTTYLIDKKGVVREVFPGTVRTRPSWKAVLNRMDELKVGK